MSTQFPYNLSFVCFEIVISIIQTTIPTSTFHTIALSLFLGYYFINENYLYPPFNWPSYSHTSGSSNNSAFINYPCFFRNLVRWFSKGVRFSSSIDETDIYSVRLEVIMALYSPTSNKSINSSMLVTWAVKYIPL